jgi:hypothetical protein
MSLLVFLCLKSSAQDFYGVLGAKPDSVIRGQNLLIENGAPLIHLKFIDAKQLKNGYMCLTYQSQIDTFKEVDFDIYYFNKNNVLCD